VAQSPAPKPIPRDKGNSDLELIKKLSKTDFIEQRLTVLEETPIIRNLKDKLPGKFVGYFDIPENNIALEDADSALDPMDQNPDSPDAESLYPKDDEQ
jgi:hypothetical protein